MSYIGAQPTTAAFITDQFNGTGSQTAFTLSVAPATTSSILVSVSGVLQDPTTYAVSGTTLTFSAAPPSGTGNISVRFLGIPASGVATTAYRTVTEFTATAGQTSFSVPSYTAGYINVYRNGALLGTSDYTATSGTTVVLANPASSGDLVVTESFFVSSVLNAIPAVANAVTTSYINSGAITAAKMAASGAWAPAGTVVQVVSQQAPANYTSTSSALTLLTQSFTPTSASNKVLALMSYTVERNGGGSGNYIFVSFLRNGSTIVSNWGNATGYQESSGARGVATHTYLDSPATTSAISYTFVADFSVSGNVPWQFYTMQLTLMEIAA